MYPWLTKSEHASEPTWKAVKHLRLGGAIQLGECDEFTFLSLGHKKGFF